MPSLDVAAKVLPNPVTAKNSEPLAAIDPQETESSAVKGMLFEVHVAPSLDTAARPLSFDIATKLLPE